MQEELHAEVVPVRCVWQHLFGDPPRTLWGWLAELTSETPSPNPSEVHEILWLTPDEAIEHPDILPYTDAFLAALLNALPPEHRGLKAVGPSATQAPNVKLIRER
jgi:hypothetical protein